jgi:hypothetical protein
LTTVNLRMAPIVSGCVTEIVSTLSFPELLVRRGRLIRLRNVHRQPTVPAQFSSTRLPRTTKGLMFRKPSPR